MNFCDIAGPPASGKSSIAYPIWGDKSVGWDSRLTRAYWRPFLDEVSTLMDLVRDHPSFSAVVRMNDRSAKKMATVERMTAPADKPVFFQSGLTQRIIGFGWRLHDMGRDVNLIRRALWIMPVSVGVAFLEADDSTLKARNADRRAVPETAHEDRWFQIPHQRPAIAIAKEVLRARGVPVIEIDVQHQGPDEARAQLLEFAGRGPCEAAKMTAGCTGEIGVPPAWWQK